MRAAKNAAAALRRDGGHAGNRTRFSRPHVRHHRLREVEHAPEIHILNPVPAIGIDIPDLDRLRDARVIDQNIDLPERFEHFGDRAFAIGLVGHIAGDTDMVRPEFRRRGFGANAIEIEDRPPRRRKSRQSCW